MFCSFQVFFRVCDNIFKNYKIYTEMDETSSAQYILINLYLNIFYTQKWFGLN